MKSINKINCCASTSYALDKNGQLYSFGDNAYGALGIDTKQQDIFGICKVNDIQKMSIVSVSCGAHHVACMDKEKRIYTFGANGSGECGHTNKFLYHFYGLKQLILKEQIK